MPISMLLYVMLYIMHAYLILFAALSNAVCLHSAYFFAIDYCKFFFSCFVLFVNTVCLFLYLFCIMHSVFNLLVLLILCPNRFLYCKCYVLYGEIRHNNNHYYD